MRVCGDPREVKTRAPHRTALWRCAMRLFARPPSAPPRHAPEGVRLYALGDVHGRLDLFDSLIERIGRDHAERGDLAAHIVLLGDYVDRGPRSAQLLDRLADGPPPWATWTLLRGNHEQVLFDICAGREGLPRRLADWLGYGGRETLRSYGVASAIAYGDDAPAMLRELAIVVPARHLALIDAMLLSARFADYLFVHAGVRPGVPLELQQPHDLLWIREPFLGSGVDHGVTVVHGHSIRADVERRWNRIGVDTGAYATGRLSAVVLEGTEVRFVSTLG